MFILMLVLLSPGGAYSAEPRVISSDASGVVIEVHGLDYQLSGADGAPRLLRLPGGAIGTEIGDPAVPSVGAVIGVPFGVDVRLDVLAAEYDRVEGVDVMTTPGPDGREVISVDRPNAWSPATPAILGRSGVMRDQRIQGVALHPLQYNPAERALRVARRLRVRLSFEANAQKPSLRSAIDDPLFEQTYRQTILNAEDARAWRARPTPTRAKQALSWYDANSDWFKIPIQEDGLYALEADWFTTSGIQLSPGDLARLQIFAAGAEIPLLVEDGGDGELDEGDRIVFRGTFRRESDRDTESIFGRTQTYWLRVGDQAGKRYIETDGAPQTGDGTVPWVPMHVHAETDSLYERWGEADDGGGDNWVNIKTASPSTPGGVEFPVVTRVPLPHLATEADFDATVRVGMHGLSLRTDIDPDHRTIVEVEGVPIAEDRWDGQAPFTAQGQIASGSLSDTTTVTLRTPGAPEYPFEPVPYVDHVHLNWITMTYPARTVATAGQFVFDAEASTDRAYEITGFSESPDLILDVTNGLRIVNAETSASDTRFRAPQSGRVVVAQTGAIRAAPIAIPDIASTLRTDPTGASYVIVTHADFAEQSEILAEHRRTQGVSAMVVDVQDIYDEFSFGDLTETAIQDFVKHAYENWSQRPTYLLLMGRMTYDYRDIMDQFKNLRAPKVPAMPFQSVRRGKAFTDHFYGTVAGDDPFMDVWVGRFSVNTAQEAETVVSKAIGYDEAPDAVWRDRVLYMANWDLTVGEELFIKDSNLLISAYARPLGLEAFPVYHDATTPPEPNESSNEVIRQINEGRLILNFMGHGSAASMSRYIAGTFQQRGFSYMTQIVNADRLPLVVAMSCLNGLYDEPTLICFAEEMVNKRDGGSIAYVSASSLAFIFVNNEVNQAMFRNMLRDGVSEFGAALGMSKNDLLASMPGIDNGVFMMNLVGDPAQRLAIPSGSDFAVTSDDIRVESDGDVLSTSDTARVTVSIRNDGIVDGMALDVAVVSRNLDTGVVDTIAVQSIPVFGQMDSMAVLWPLGGKVGRHELEVILDPDQRLNEIRRDNDVAVAEIEVFGRLSAVLAFPIESQAVGASVTLGVRTGIDSGASVFGEFEAGRDPALNDASVRRSGRIQASNNLSTWTPGELESGVWFWRARMSAGSEDGAWSQVKSFSVGAAAPARSVVWRQDASQANRLSDADGIVAYDDGSLGRTLEPLPLSITAAFREASVTAEGAPSTAVLATDGVFHYVKGFYSLPQIYPDSDTYLKIGSGFGGTTAGENLGPVSDPDIPSVSATYHGDGFVYADNRKSREIVRISPSTGETTIVPVDAGLLEVRSGLVFDGHSLFTSDGSLIYNVANGVNGVPRTGWTVRVFDPGDEWRVVREYTVDPTSTGFSFAFTDGLLADGKYLYLIEFGTGSNHRVRVVDALDGRFVDEYQSDQAVTDLLSGQYDWVNNKVWFGQLSGNQIHRYTGRRLPDEGVLTSPPIGPSSAWKSLSVNLTGSASEARLDLLGETMEGVVLPIAEWSDMPAGDVDLSTLDTSIDRIRLRLRLAGPELKKSAGLRSWDVAYQPVTDVSIANLQMSATEVNELEPVLLTVDVTNRGPIDTALGAVVAFYAGDPDNGRVIGRQAVPENTPIGTPREVLFAWITAQWAGTHRVTARVEDLFGNEAFYKSTLVADQVIEVRSSNDVSLPTIDIRSLDATGEIRSGDYLPADTDFLIVVDDSSGIDRASVEVLLTTPDDQLPTAGVGSNLVSELTEGPTRTSFRYSPPAFDDGTHTIEIRANDRIGNGPATKSISFEVTSDLRLENVLNYPNPMATETDFTFLLSRPSDVVIKIHTVAGRLIRILEEPSGRAGYNQIHWDGLDSQGRAIANGTYLYTITVDDGQDRVRKKEKLIVYR